MTISKLRKDYHKKIVNHLLRIRENSAKGDYPNNADGDSKISVKIAWEVVNRITKKPIVGSISGQEAGSIFEKLTKEFLEKSFKELVHLPPGKWTLRSDRGQNSRSEALNLIRNRKGKLPHIVAVTAEPTPTRIASLALGTGDIDCVYHFALCELREALIQLDDESQLDMLNTLVEGRRLRDISDLPFDLAI